MSTLEFDCSETNIKSALLTLIDPVPKLQALERDCSIERMDSSFGLYPTGRRSQDGASFDDPYPGQRDRCSVL
jgi:hypothetical protein